MQDLNGPLGGGFCVFQDLPPRCATLSGGWEMHLSSTTKQSYKQGFTIVELLVVVVVIAILAVVSVVGYNGIASQAREVALAGNLDQAAKKVVLHYIQKASYPDNLAVVGISESGDTNYQYFSSDEGYCITVSNGGSVAHVAGSKGNINTVILDAPCLGHVGDTTVTSSSLDCPEGFIVVPGNSLLNQPSFCVMKYEAKNNGSDVAVSQAAGAPWVNITQTAAISAAQTACDNCQLITESQWMTIAANVLSVPSNWSEGAVGEGYVYSGHNDNSPNGSLAASSNDSDGYSGTGEDSGNQRRTLALSNGEVLWDLAGNVYEWTGGIIEGSQPGLDTDDTIFTWKDWSHSDMNWNSFPNSSTPGYLASMPALADINTLSAANGLGMLYSNQNQAAVHPLARGGYWYSDSYAGVFTLPLNYTPGWSYGHVGFRVTSRGL